MTVTYVLQWTRFKNEHSLQTDDIRTTPRTTQIRDWGRARVARASRAVSKDVITRATFALLKVVIAFDAAVNVLRHLSANRISLALLFRAVIDEALPEIASRHAAGIDLAENLVSVLGDHVVAKIAQDRRQRMCCRQRIPWPVHEGERAQRCRRFRVEFIALDQHNGAQVDGCAYAAQQVLMLLLGSELDPSCRIAVSHEIYETITEVADAVKHEPRLYTCWWLKCRRNNLHSNSSCSR